MTKSLHIDFGSVLSHSAKIIKSSEIFGRTDELFRAKHHDYRNVGRSVFLHIQDFTVEQPYLIDMHRPNLVCFQITLGGKYNRWAEDSYEVVDSTVVQITNFPRTTIDVEAGVRLRAVLIVIDRECLVEEYGLKVGNIPAMYRPLFGSPIGMSRAMRIRAPSSIRLSAEQILSCHYSEPLRGMFLASKTIEIVCEMVDKLNSYPAARSSAIIMKGKNDAVETAAAIYRREFRKPPTIEQLSIRVGVNRNALTSGFMELYGVTPHSYSLQVRMKEAQAMLDLGVLSISEIGRQIGYGGYASFARAYVEHFGHPPRRGGGVPPGVDLGKGPSLSNPMAFEG